MKYNHRISSKKRAKYFKRLYIFIIVLFLVLAMAVGFLRFDAYLQNKKNTPDKTTTEKTTAYYDVEDKVYRSQYFQFQTLNTWKAIPDQSTDSKYVYRSFSGSLIEEELSIYVGDVPSDLHATRILPTTIKPSGQLEPGKVSEHCLKALGGQSSSQDKRISFSGVTMLCDSDSTQYEVLVGLKGGSTDLTLKRPDGSEDSYSIFYRNVKANPEPRQLYQIISSFQTR